MEEIRDTMNLLSSYSRYAFEDKIRQGFLTIPGGHRVGLAGRAILDQTTAGGMVKTISPVTFLNIRIARHVIGCGEQVLPWLWEKAEIHDSLLISSPGMGKTTLLRDLIRLVSYQGMTVGVVDERSELAACYQGIPQNDLGPRTDVLDGCPKTEGLMMLVRTMAPPILAVDEVGSEADHYALEYAMHCGSRLLVTAHGGNWEEALRRPILGRWLKEERFGRYVLIEKKIIGQNRMFRYQVCDQKGEIIASVESGNE
jgi:stage III sporulation protein AA